MYFFEKSCIEKYGQDAVFREVKIDTRDQPNLPHKLRCMIACFFAGAAANVAWAAAMVFSSASISVTNFFCEAMGGTGIFIWRILVALMLD